MTSPLKKSFVGMTADLPEPVATLRHRRRFKRDEVIEALKHYLVSNGAKVPEGECHLTGIESYSQQEEYLTLMIDERISL